MAFPPMRRPPRRAAAPFQQNARAARAIETIGRVGSAWLLVTVVGVYGGLTLAGAPVAAQSLLDFALPDEGPPTSPRGASPSEIPLTDEGPRAAPPPPPPAEAAAPEPPPPPVRTVATPRFRDARLRRPRPDLSDLTRLRFLSVPDFEPFTDLDREGRPVGYHVDLARAVCDALEITERCQFQVLPFAQLRPALARGDGEAIVAGIRPTVEARADLAFTGPYLRFPARFVARRDSGFDPAISTTSDADRGGGTRVGVVGGSAHEAMLRALFPGVTPVVAPDMEGLRRAVSEGAVDAAFADGAGMATWLASPAGDCCAFRGGAYHSNHFLGPGLRIAVPADEPDLLAALEWALAQAEENGALDEAYLRAFPVGFYE